MPPSCTTRCTYFVFDALLTIMFGRVFVLRFGSELIISNPHHTVHAPLTMKASPRLVADVAPATSMMARSPGYCRMTTGFPGAPATVATNAPRYVPPCSQTVSPGWTWPPAPASAYARLHGALLFPALPVVPLADTCHPVSGVRGGGGGAPVPVVFSNVHATSRKLRIIGSLVSLCLDVMVGLANRSD